MKFFTLFLDMSCWWVVQTGFWGPDPKSYGFFLSFTDARNAADAMNKLVPTELEKSLCRTVTESRPK